MCPRNFISFYREDACISMFIGNLFSVRRDESNLGVHQLINGNEKVTHMHKEVLMLNKNEVMTISSKCIELAKI